LVFLFEGGILGLQMIKRKALFLFLLALVVVLPFQGTRPLFVPLSLLSARVLPALPYPRVLLGCWLLFLILLKMAASFYLSSHSLSL